MSLRIERGDQVKAMNDSDGYPAVKVWNTVWVEEPRWITASATDSDMEWLVRDLAQQLVAMADNMAAMRKAETR